jgi:hypothetical protein
VIFVPLAIQILHLVITPTAMPTEHSYLLSNYLLCTALEAETSHRYGKGHPLPYTSGFHRGPTVGVTQFRLKIALNDCALAIEHIQYEHIHSISKSEDLVGSKPASRSGGNVPELDKFVAKQYEFCPAALTSLASLC